MENSLVVSLKVKHKIAIKTQQLCPGEKKAYIHIEIVHISVVALFIIVKMGKVLKMSTDC